MVSALLWELWLILHPVNAHRKQLALYNDRPKGWKHAAKAGFVWNFLSTNFTNYLQTKGSIPICKYRAKYVSFTSKGVIYHAPVIYRSNWRKVDFAVKSLSLSQQLVCHFRLLCINIWALLTFVVLYIFVHHDSGVTFLLGDIFFPWTLLDKMS